MRKILFILKFVSAILLLSFLLIFTNERQRNQTINLNNIIITNKNVNYLNKELILDYLNNQSITFDNISIQDFSKRELEKFLNNHPGIKKVEVFSNQKGFIDILIEPKKALIRIKSHIDDYYLDEFGEKMVLLDNYFPNLIVATGIIYPHHHFGIYEFVKEINKSAFWNAQVTQIHFEKNNIFLIPRLGNQKIQIGDFKNIMDRLENLYHLYKIAMPIKGWQTYSDINLKFNNQIICTKK
tara:strand:+ start:3971 stop:4690 length:720 start_codon:yes stop_codon:yes gene_type:complete